MHGKPLLTLLISVLRLMLVGLVLSQCSVQQPKASNTKFSTPVADHTRFTDPCSSCHEFKRLPPTKDLLVVAHGFGRDCAECHQHLTGKADWKPKAYSHSPNPPSCLGCHNLPGEAAKFKVPTAHANGQLRGDCVSCHRFGTKWKTN